MSERQESEVPGLVEVPLEGVKALWAVEAGRFDLLLDELDEAVAARRTALVREAVGA